MASTIQWIPGLLAGDGVRRPPIELAVRTLAAESKAAPFVVLADGSRFSQVVLARIALPDGTTLVPLALKIPRHVVRDKGSGFCGVAVVNREVDAMWQRERNALKAAAGPVVVPFFDLVRDDPVTEGLSDGGGALPALNYCRRRQLLFPVPSPQTWDDLELCRDDRLLREHGLEPYSTSTVRYLYSPAELEVGGAERPTFYTWSADSGADARSSCRVRRRTELYADFALIRQVKLTDVQRERLAPKVPCLSCQYAAECLEGDAEDLPVVRELVPLTVAPSPVLFTRAMARSFAEWCDELGGAQLSSVMWDNGVESSGQSGGLFDLGRGPEFAAEALCLKLIAFEQVCAAVTQFHTTEQRPLFGVTPEAFRVEPSAVGQGLPQKWNFVVRLNDLGAQHRLSLASDVSHVPDLFVPTADAAADGLSPFADASAAVQELNMQMTIQSAEVQPVGCVLTVDAKAQGTRIHGVRPGDVAVIEPHSELPGLGESALLATVLRVQPGGFQASVELLDGVELADDCVPMSCSALVTLYRRLHVPCDLHGLGMMLARALLVNDEADAFAVEDEVGRVLEKLLLAVAGVEEPDRAYVVTTLGGLFEKELKGSGVERVLFHAKDRENCRRASMDPACTRVWTDALVLMMRLVARIPEFAFCTEHDDYSPERPQDLVTSVRAEVHALVRRLRVELFGQQTRGREIGRLCEGLLTEINAELYGKEGA